MMEGGEGGEPEHSSAESSGPTEFGCHTNESGHPSTGPGTPDAVYQGLILPLLSCDFCVSEGLGPQTPVAESGHQNVTHPKGIRIVRMTRKSRGRGPLHNSWHTEVLSDGQLPS